MLYMTRSNISPEQDRIEVTIDEKRNVISVWNNGKGIPVIRHAQYEGIYIPELVMGNLLAGSNFDDSEKRLGGGRHGYGAKLTNIFSHAFTVETGDSVRQLLYTQTWRDNMSVREPAAVTPLAAGTMDYTRITFSVDIARFSKQAKKLDKDIVALWARRVLDVAGCNPGIKCFLNGRLVKVSSQLARTLLRMRKEWMRHANMSCANTLTLAQADLVHACLNACVGQGDCRSGPAVL